MRKMCKRCGELDASSGFISKFNTSASSQASSWAAGSAAPELFKFFGKLLSGSRPIVADAFTELHNMTLEVKLILLEPGDIQFLSCTSALELPSNIFFVVPDDPIIA